MRSSRTLIAGAGLALLLIPWTAEAGPSLDDDTKAALRDALADERLAEATYAAVIERHGDVRPFTNIVGAERRHQRWLLDLFERYGIAVPAAPSHDPEVADTIAAACADGITAEKRNIALYDAALKRTTAKDVRTIFARLRDASKERHLPAFRRCVDRAAGRGPRR